MKAVFLTSNLGGYNRIVNGNEVEEQITKCDNSNYFVDRLKNAVPKIKNFVFIASDPECSSKTDKYANNIVKSLNLDGFEIENLIVLDHRFSESIENTILSADVVFLAGGNVLIQNKYFKEISLKSILTKFNGVLIGQSAGSMNCSKIVYNQPEEEEEFKDKNFKKKLSGLGLVNFSLMPHMNCAEEASELKKIINADLKNNITSETGGFNEFIDDNMRLLPTDYINQFDKFDVCKCADIKPLMYLFQCVCI